MVSSDSHDSLRWRSRIILQTVLFYRSNVFSCSLEIGSESHNLSLTGFICWNLKQHNSHQKLSLWTGRGFYIKWKCFFTAFTLLRKKVSNQSIKIWKWEKAHVVCCERSNTNNALTGFLNSFLFFYVIEEWEEVFWNWNGTSAGWTVSKCPQIQNVEIMRPKK